MASSPGLMLAVVLSAECICSGHGRIELTQGHVQHHVDSVLDPDKVSGRPKALCLPSGHLCQWKNSSWCIFMPQKLPQKAVAAKHPCCKLNVPPVAPARSFYLVSQLRQQICLLRRDAWKTGFVIARRRWCSSNSLQSCSEEELICEAEGTKSGHIFLKWR